MANSSYWLKSREFPGPD